MPTTAINNLANTQQSQAASNMSNRFAEMSSEQFIRVLITELTNQDPFQPNDSTAILEQLSSLRNIESQLKLQQKLESMVLQNGVTQAGALIGKMVEGLDSNNNTVTGLVTSVRVVNGKAELELDNAKTLPIDRLLRITNAQAGA